MLDDAALTAFAEGPLDDTDSVVLDAVRALHARIDPVPSGLTDRIKFELTLAALHAEIAELSRVSLAGVREDTIHYAPTESVTFTSSTLSLMVTFGPAGEGVDPDTVRIDGWVTGDPASVELRLGDASYTATPDEHGRFVIESVPHGSARFVLRPLAGSGADGSPGTHEHPGERAVITPSIEV
jgi:hypothetical protein